MALRDPLIEHLLRRAGFGASAADLDVYSDLGFATALDRLINYESIFDDVDGHIGEPGYVAITARAGFAPASNITDARQRWLFRMVHTKRPLQEKMALFWHNHFATAYSKVSGNLNAAEGTRAWLRSRRKIRRVCAANSSCSASTPSAISGTSCWPLRRTSRCWCGSTAAPT